MFQSHLDEHPIVSSPSALGQEPQPVEAGSHDVAVPQSTLPLDKYKPVITVLAVAAIAYIALKAMKKEKIAPTITG